MRNEFLLDKTEKSKQYFNFVEKTICECLNLDFNIFKTKHKSTPYTEARAILFHITYDLNDKFIGLKQLGWWHRDNYNHASVIHQLDNYEYWYGTDMEFTRKSDLVLDTLIELEENYVYLINSVNKN